MECDGIKQIMASFLSGELDEAKADSVRQHLIHCAGCQQELDAYKETWSLLQSWEDEEPVPGYISRFWTRVSLERSWGERIQGAFGKIFSLERFVPVMSAVCALLIIGVLTARITQSRQTETLLTDLTVEEIEFVENIELAENLDLLEEMEMLESLKILDDISLNDRYERQENV